MGKQELDLPKWSGHREQTEDVLREGAEEQRADLSKC